MRNAFLKNAEFENLSIRILIQMILLFLKISKTFKFYIKSIMSNTKAEIDICIRLK